MDIFCDTSVLFPALISAHPRHNTAKPILESVVSRKNRGFIAAQSIDDLFSTLPRLNVRPKIHPQDAKRLVEVSVLNHFEVVSLHRDDYREAMEKVTSLGLSSLKFVDALLLAWAIRSGAERIYTFDVEKYRRIAPPEILSRICAP